MKRINPLLNEEDDPIDALQRVSFILGFLRDFQAYSSGALTFSRRSREGLIFLISLLEDTSMQISEALLDKERGTLI
ncbi:MAG: hypothetical protein OEV42_01100 [Deltaproteobacteria bacterium]|nr:hypothetical protein [Deltaproteobacteria bacterium]